MKNTTLLFIMDHFYKSKFISIDDTKIVYNELLWQLSLGYQFSSITTSSPICDMN